MDITALGLVAFAGIMMVAFYHAWMSFKHRNRENPDSAVHFFTRGVFAGKEIFTERGLHHRKLAHLYQMIALIVWFVFLVLS